MHRAQTGERNAVKIKPQAENTESGGRGVARGPAAGRQGVATAADAEAAFLVHEARVVARDVIAPPLFRGCCVAWSKAQGRSPKGRRTAHVAVVKRDRLCACGLLRGEERVPEDDNRS